MSLRQDEFYKSPASFSNLPGRRKPLRVCIYIGLCYVYVCTHMNTYTHICTYVYICMCMVMYVHMFAYMCVCMHVYVHTYVYMCMCMYS